jgi:LCP family protein required for cell wall assembly
MSKAGPRPLCAAALSAILPGAGQIYAGRRRRGLWLIGITLAASIPAFVVVILLYGPWDFGTVDIAIDIIRPFFKHPALVLALFATIIALLAFRVFAVLDAFAAADRPRRLKSWRRVLALGTVLAPLLALIAWPHGWAGVRTLDLYEAITYDYAADPQQVALPPTTSTTTATTLQSGSSTVPTTPSTTTTSTTTTIAPSPFAGEGRVTVALLGSDAGPGRYGVRTDTIIVVSIDPESGHTAMFSVPRNQAQWPIPEGIPAYSAFTDHRYPDLIWGVYAYGLAHPDLFPGGPNTGGNAVKAVLGEGLGIEIDYFVLVDLLGFIEIVDAVGGIDIYISMPVHEDNVVRPDGTVLDVDIPVGEYHFDGNMALDYVRLRHQDSDYYRMDRQRCVLEAAVARADLYTLIRRLPEITDIIENNLRTDIPASEFPDFLELLLKIDTSQVVAVRFVPAAPELAGTGTSYISGVDAAGYGMPNLELIRDTVQTVLENPPDEAMATLRLDSLHEVCAPA